MNAVIRRAGPEDIPALVGLLRLLFSIEKDFVFNAAKQERGLRLLLANAQTAVIVAVQSGQVIGMCTGQLLISTAQGGLSALVEDVAVQPDHQGKGIGRRLVAAAEAWAVSQGASRIQLLADRNNAPALAFYQKMKFQTTAMICLRKML
ncbi:GNAT family N-acetyltransferase [Desulfobulbus sp. F4]|nr:GNAT family N-acetyltransferase [Desulfobulbus sp. F3]MCW5201224.1 GNAT family N-acetyltransferase [Desulfobulbus sp. F4]